MIIIIIIIIVSFLIPPFITIDIVTYTRHGYFMLIRLMYIYYALVTAQKYTTSASFSAFRKGYTVSLFLIVSYTCVCVCVDRYDDVTKAIGFCETPCRRPWRNKNKSVYCVYLTRSGLYEPAPTVFHTCTHKMYDTYVNELHFRDIKKHARRRYEHFIFFFFSNPPLTWGGFLTRT